MKKFIYPIFVISLCLGACDYKDGQNNDAYQEQRDQRQATEYRKISMDDTGDIEQDIVNEGLKSRTQNPPNFQQQHKENYNTRAPSQTAQGFIPAELEGFEEIIAVSNYLDLRELAAEIEVNIPNKRTILYKDNQDHVYKSIFIKDDRNLRIVDLKNNQLIFNADLD